MIIIGFVIAVFFILMICLICRGYLDDIIELENRVLKLEKRISYQERYCDDFISDFLDFKKETIGKDGEKEMACKKGRGGKRK